MANIPLVLPPLKQTCTGWSACGRPEGCGWHRGCYSQLPRPQAQPQIQVQPQVQAQVQPQVQAQVQVQFQVQVHPQAQAQAMTRDK